MVIHKNCRLKVFFFVAGEKKGKVKRPRATPVSIFYCAQYKYIEKVFFIHKQFSLLLQCHKINNNKFCDFCIFYNIKAESANSLIVFLLLFISRSMNSSWNFVLLSDYASECTLKNKKKIYII